MRRFFLLTLAIVLCGSIGFGLYIWKRSQRLAPTPIAWRANVITIAGNGAPVFRDSNQPSEVGFADPFGIAIAPDGTIYIADAGESNRIRKLTTDGVVTTLAGSSEGFADGPGAQASLNSPSGIALDAAGNLFVADTGNNRIRKVTPDGTVSTIAGDGVSGYADGPAAKARFDAPVGVAVDRHGNVLVADTYNDRIRKIDSNGQVTTVGGAGRGNVDGDASTARFDTPCGVVVASDGSLIIADTGNSRLRKINSAGQVTTMPVTFDGGTEGGFLRQPIGLATTHDGVIYVSELNSGRVIQIATDGRAALIADRANDLVFNQLAGLAIDDHGDLYLADNGNFLVHKLSHGQSEGRLARWLRPAPQYKAVSLSGPVPRLNSETLGQNSLLWPLDPQDRPHEVVATMGEVRGSFDPPESRDHLHSGLDVFSELGGVVRAIRSEKVVSPTPNWAFGNLNEGIRVGFISYIHIHVGRDKDGKIVDDKRFVPLNGGDGKMNRVRVRRGTRFLPGDVVGSVNRMYHVHLNVGASGAEINPLSLSPIGFMDKIAPTIEKDGIQLLDESGARLNQTDKGRTVVRGRVRIVVDAFDRADMNAERRRLGLYRLGYQLLKSDGTPAAGFEQPRITMEFNRLPPDDDATKIAYAEASGITVYGSEQTRFLYEVTNIVRDGHAEKGTWNAEELPEGDYVLRIIAADFFGNEASEGRDLLISIRK
jgi:sugar lactone lactonase YvrE